MDDAGVYRITPDIALVQTVDFFYPPLNDPVSCGRVVAANCLSDVWAMGGRPVTAMNILAYPAGLLPADAVEDMLRGACEKLVEADVALMGGHTLEQEELVYGLSVTGLIHPDHARSNTSARPGDRLVLTKPIGTGVYCNALQQNALSPERYSLFVETMERLNGYACDVMKRFDVGALTDVTGFGLLGHAYPVALGSDVILSISSSLVPLLDGVTEMLARFHSKGVCKSRDLVEPRMRLQEGVDPQFVTLFCEAQTSGGLLATVRPEQAEELVEALREAGDPMSSVIGEVRQRTGAEIDAGLYLEVSS